MTISKIYNTDCMEYMKTIPDRTFDLCVADPPYFSGPEKRGFYGKRKGLAYRSYHINDENWNVPGPELFDEIKRVSKHYIVFGCNYYDYVFAPGRIVWNKCNGDSSFSDCELAATDLFSSVRMFSYMWNGMCQGKSIREGHIMQGNKSLNEKRIHPTQKPIALYQWIFQKYAKQGWKILDPFLGSGSSRIAAYFAGLDFYGCEINQYYFEAQHQRYLNVCHGQEISPNGTIIIQQSLF